MNESVSGPVVRMSGIIVGIFESGIVTGDNGDCASGEDPVDGDDEDGEMVAADVWVSVHS